MAADSAPCCPRDPFLCGDASDPCSCGCHNADLRARLREAESEASTLRVDLDAAREELGLVRLKLRQAEDQRAEGIEAWTQRTAERDQALSTLAVAEGERDQARRDLATLSAIHGESFPDAQAAWRSFAGQRDAAIARAEQAEALADRIRAEWPLADRAFDEGRRAALRGEHLHSILHPDEPYWVHQFRSRGVDYGGAQAQAESLAARLTACQDGAVAWMTAFGGRFNERPTQARARLDKAHHDNIRGLTRERDEALSTLAALRVERDAIAESEATWNDRWRKAAAERDALAARVAGMESGRSVAVAHLEVERDAARSTLAQVEGERDRLRGDLARLTGEEMREIRRLTRETASMRAQLAAALDSPADTPWEFLIAAAQSREAQIRTVRTDALSLMRDRDTARTALAGVRRGIEELAAQYEAHDQVVWIKTKTEAKRLRALLTSVPVTGEETDAGE